MERALTAALEASLLRVLVSEWARLNWTHFRNAMRQPGFSFTDARSLLGRYVHATRQIEISRPLVVERPWGQVLEVLKHEMAHQYVAEVLGRPDEQHGPVFRGVCASLGIDAKAVGMPTAEADAGAPGETGSRVLDRIRRLLSLAASQNQHEAEAAMRLARKLMLQHNLDEVATRTTEGYVVAHVGRVTGRRADWEALLGRILIDHFFVAGIYVPAYRPLDGVEGSVLEIVGTPTNVEMAKYVFSFLEQAADRLHRAFVEGGGRATRGEFLAGVMRGFLDKLELERRANAGEGLVWVADPGLGRFHAARHPRVRSTSRAGRARTEGFEEGRAAGRSLTLARPVESGPSGGAPKRLRG